jgi:uncharacterized sulfatase
VRIGFRVFIALVLLTLQSLATAAAPATRPNILWISAEDLSPDLRCYGDQYAITPNLDRLASEGVRFERAFSTAPVCSPSRCSIITGMYASSVGGHNHRSSIVPAPEVKCFTEYLRSAGYYCTNNSKTDYNFPPPKDAWDESSRKAHWRNRKDKSQPFFAVFNFLETHEGHAYNKGGQFSRLTKSLSQSEKHDPAKGKLPSYYPDTPIVRENWARWYDCITVMDQRIQTILDELKEDGLAENTIVFFWGDHGRGLPRGKRWLYDSGLRVPLIVRWPGHLQPGTVREDLVTLMDLGPTLLSLTGVNVPPQMQGRVILGEKQQPEPQYVFATRDRMDETPDMMRSVRSRQFKYIKNFHPELPYAQPIKYMDDSPIMREWRRLASEGKLTGAPALFFAKTKPAEELYDVEKDPEEIHNLAGDADHQDVLNSMRAALNDWQTKTHDLGLIPEDELMKRIGRKGGSGGNRTGEE